MAFVTLLSNVLPICVYESGVFYCSLSIMCKLRMLAAGNSSNLTWKQVFSLRQLKKQLHSQQLVHILSYISQIWKAPPSCWIHLLSHATRPHRLRIYLQWIDSGGSTKERHRLWCIYDGAVADRIYKGMAKLEGSHKWKRVTNERDSNQGWIFRC
ncbi:hypothetical protein LINPERHAP2_LOCUS17845 [Linum perenne]